MQIAGMIYQSRDQSPSENSKSLYVQSVAGQQVGLQNYRRKAKRSKADGLKNNFEFQNDVTDDSLNRILGKGRRNNKVTVNMRSGSE